MPTVTPPRIVSNVNAEVNSNTIVGISNEGNTNESYTVYQACPYSREGDDVGSVDSVELYDSMLGRGGRIKFTIPFNPQPLPRPRFYKKGIANTKKSYMEDVRNILEKNKPEFCPVDKSIPLSVSITLYLKRPLDNFKGRTRDPLKLKSVTNWFRTPRGGDIDNYAKLYLDCMNKIVFADDKQVVHLKVFKVPHNDDNCLGKCIIVVQQWF